ncbi:hypothetical protein CNYM01_07611 [Colletotrichum nymphaeae SA-01]|uniref:Uncharacterized protein n=1 Tax=Colletotrichum nymphaeae SA-01 TaxID=1460502 RepID=A0A135TN57_9PEZI|nr:hypothetical protein CNYM01_07611 [Colletotrichum nymphaeae SA-01]
MSQSTGESNSTTNDMDIDPNDPSKNDYDWALGAHERIGPDTESLKLSAASFDVKTSPGHMENTYVGHISWLVSWFPYNAEHLTIYFTSATERIRFSIPEPIVAQNFHNFPIFSLGRDLWQKEQPLPREYEFLREDADAFGLITSFLMTGTFPQHPHARVRSASDMITELIHAGELSFKLGLRCEVRFNRAVSLQLRQLLLEDRTTLRESHIARLNKLLARHKLSIPWGFRQVFAQAMVKPWLRHLDISPVEPVDLCPGSAKIDTIWNGDDPEEWSIIIKHCLGLIGQSERFRADVRWHMIQTLEDRKKSSPVIAGASRYPVTSIIPGSLLPPVTWSFVTYHYSDPLVPAEGKVKAQRFTTTELSRSG